MTSGKSSSRNGRKKKMKIEYKFANPALIGMDLEYGKVYQNPLVHSVLLTKDDNGNDVLTVTLIVPVESI